MKIIFPELERLPEAAEIKQQFQEVEFVGAKDLETAVLMLKDGAADSMISGFDYSSRDVLLAYKKHLDLKSRYFSSCFLMERGQGCQAASLKSGDLTSAGFSSMETSNSKSYHFALADGGVCKNPDIEQLYTIVEDTARTFLEYYEEPPRIAMLSYSTNGSGGKNSDLEKIRAVIARIRTEHPEYEIDGEMQLDAAVSPEIGTKKFPASSVAGRANILITPDLNSGNILYKGLEQFGGFVVAGPLIQGFIMPLADLSRGSTVADIILTLKVLAKQLKTRAHVK